MSTPIHLGLTTVAGLSGSGGGLSYGETNEGWNATLNNNTQSEATRTLICRWSDVNNMVDWLLGTNNYTVSSGFATTYIVGAAHPIFAGLYCDQVRVDAYTGVSSGESTFDYAKLICHYKSVPFNVGSPAVIREDSIEPCGRVYHLPPEFFPKSVSQSEASTKTPASTVYVPMYKITSTLLGVSTVPLTAIGNCTNKLSNADLTFNYGGSSYTITANTILYCGASSKRTVLSNGVSKYDVTHTFLVSPIHNKGLDATQAGSGASSFISMFINSADGFTIYTTADFSTLGV